MAGERYFTRIPPSSTGNRIGLKHTAAVSYTNKTGTFRDNQIVTLGTSNITLTIYTHRPITGTTGVLICGYDKDSTFLNASPVAGESIFDENSNLVGQVGNSVEDIFQNVNQILSYDNPSYGLKIDQAGSANIRFSEGVPQLDAFGKLRVSGATLLGEYVFANGIMPIHIATTEIGAGASTWDSVIRALKLQTGSASGDIARATSNTYHHYIPGSSHLFIATLAMSDPGKANLVRNWGMYDADNGVFFQLDGTTLSAVIRSDASGTQADTVIPRTQWNVDKLDGTGPSGMTIDVTKDNLYFIDAQWLGAGRVRFGVYNDGARVVCHEYNHNNRYPYPFCATMSLPVRFSQTNTGVVGSTSEMRVFCISVWTETNIDVRTLAARGLQSVNKELPLVDTEYYVASLSPPEFYDNGKPNHALYFPSEVEIIAWDSVTGASVPVEVTMYANPVLGGLTYVDGESSMEVDTSGTWYGGGQKVFKSLAPGHEHTDLTNYYDGLLSALKNFADDGGTLSMPIATVSNSSPAIVTVPANWQFREGNPLTIRNCAGMTEANGQTVYLKLTGAQSAELYTDSALTTPFDTSTYGDYTGLSGELYGYYGSRFNLTITARRLFGSNTTKVIVKVAWKEIVQ